MHNSTFIILFHKAFLCSFTYDLVLRWGLENKLLKHYNLLNKSPQITVIAYLNIRQPHFSCDSLPLGKSFEVKAEEGGGIFFSGGK